MKTTDDEEPGQETAAAAAAVGGPPAVVETNGAAPPSAWARRGRLAIQSSHSLSAPLARAALERLASTPVAPGAAEESGSAISIPASVFHERPRQRLPEDVVCRSPIAGLVVAVAVSAGERVARRQPVVTVEAMKMQNHICAEVDGTVKAVHVSTGDAVKAGQILFELA